MEKKNIIEKLINPKLVKISTLLALIVVFSCLIIGYIIAQFGPYGYNMFDNYISDMGSRKYTPFPYTRTISNIISGPLFLSLTFYMKKQLISKSLEIPKIRRMLGTLGFIGMLILFIGMMFTGIITEDVSMQIHTYLAIIAIFGGVLATVSYGILITAYPTNIPKNVGIYMMLCIPIIAILTMIGYPSQIFYEWILLFSLYSWIILCSVFLLKHTDETKYKMEII